MFKFKETARSGATRKHVTRWRSTADTLLPPSGHWTEAPRRGPAPAYSRPTFHKHTPARKAVSRLRTLSSSRPLEFQEFGTSVRVSNVALVAP